MALAAQVAWAQTPLSEKPAAGDACRYRLEMKLQGERRFRQDDEEVKQALSATATHQFVERVLAVGANGLIERAARHYDQARVVITVGDRPFETVLGSQRRLIVAQRHKDDLICYAPNGSLTREELDVTADHLDTLTVSGLLPGKAVASGESWKPGNATMQALCAFDGLISHDVTGKLVSASGGLANLSFTGTAQGIELGALVKRTITATGQFDLKAQRLTRLDWKQRDEREAGPISPASTIETTWSLERQPLASLPKEVSDVALVQVPEGSGPPAARFLNLVHADAKGRYRLAYPRDWQIVGQTENHLILRLLDRGDFVAQATCAWLTPAGPGKHMSVEEFKQLVNDMPGWEAEQLRDDGEVQSGKDQWIYRLSGVGDLDGLRVLQVFYLVAGKGGQQLAIHFTLRPALADKLGSKDLDLINGLELPPLP
jgi:hypothetical protein